jgi:formylglycine-generating enzyme required for sulfatase activity
VELPLVLKRGGRERVRLALPATVPEGYVYVPPGCFLSGTSAPEEMREFLHSAPLHRVCMGEGYLIGRHEVTVGEWLKYLQSLPEGAAAQRLLETLNFGGPGAVELRRLPEGGWAYALHRTSGQVLRAREGEPLCFQGRTRRACVDWRRLPLTGVSVEDMQGYFAWLDKTRRMPGARLCGEREWERAARGADDRTYPHGDRMGADDANIDVTYSRRLESFGPDEVGSHPESVSPYGVMDMSGNAFELVRAETPDLGPYVLRGGAWFYERVSSRVENRVPGTSTMRDVTVGVRVCASFTAQ